MSHPTRVRGLKRTYDFGAWKGSQVAPHTGAWIETEIDLSLTEKPTVAPHTGAWIETSSTFAPETLYHVAPHTGAWIETNECEGIEDKKRGRTPHGCVD